MIQRIKSIEPLPELTLSVVMPYEYGREWDPDFTKLTPAEAEAVAEAEAEIGRGETVSHEAINWN